MSEVVFNRQGETIEFTATDAITAGECRLIAGLCAFAVASYAVGQLAVMQILGNVKALGTVTSEPAAPKGSLVFWNATTNKASVVGGTFLMGILAADAAAEATRLEVLLNTVPPGAAGFAGKTLSRVAVDTVLDAQDTGKLMIMTADSKTFTLPATVAGLELICQCDVSGGAATMSVSPSASDKIMGPDVAGVDDKDYLLDGDGAQGDYLHLIGDGADGWFVKASRGNWTQEA